VIVRNNRRRRRSGSVVVIIVIAILSRACVCLPILADFEAPVPFSSNKFLDFFSLGVRKKTLEKQLLTLGP
jgi:hypothetical protein